MQAVHEPQDPSWHEVAKILSAQVNHVVSVEQINNMAMREHYLAAGMPAKMADAVLAMSTGLRDDFQPIGVTNTV